jgi:large subunit ribosomal protein L2
MGKNLIQQARGKGGPRYRAPSFRYRGDVRFSNKSNSGVITDFVTCQGHSAPLARIKYSDGDEGYMIAAEGLRIGDTVYLGKEAATKTGNALVLKDIPIGTSIFNIEIMPGDGGKFVRSGGTYAKVLSHTEDKVLVQLPSKKKREFDAKCRACIGTVAGGGRKEKPFLKAGRRFYYMRARNKLYPNVRGQAMNAVDHPYGTSRSSKKGQPTIADKNAPPGAKVGKIRARRTGKKR